MRYHQRVKTLVGLVIVLSGCTRRVYDPPARLSVGATTRHHAATPVDNTRSFRAVTTTPEPEMLAAQEAKLVGIGFTMASGYGTYAGGEVETGVLEGESSTAAGVYGLFGFRHALPGVNLAVELAAGQRWLRYGGPDGEVSSLIAEPRVRADVWLGQRLALGAVGGVTVGDESAWMVGFYLGIHSHDFGSGARD
jgi:hypothetical protein